MPDIERAVITLNEKPTSPYVKAIEGLIFDPQPPVLVLRSYMDPRTGSAIFHWQNPEPEDWILKPAASLLLKSWEGMVAPRFSDLNKGARRVDTDYNLPGPPFYVAESFQFPLITIIAALGWQFDVDFAEVRANSTRLLYSYLRIAETSVVRAGAKFFMNNGGVTRGAGEADFDQPYIPNFTEQQRLLDVYDLLAQHT